MADFNIQPLGTQIRPPQQMSLGEMVNLARGVQAYQQATQINPVELAISKQQLSRLQQLTPEEVAKAQAEAQVATQTVAPRVSASQSAAATAQAQSSQAQLEATRAFLKNTRTEASDLLKQPEITYEDIVNRFKKTLENSPADEATREKVLAQAMSSIPRGLKSDQYRAYLAQELVKTVTAENQLSTMFPSISMLGTGQAAIPVTTGSALAVQQPGVPTGAPGIPMQPPPTTEVVDPRTGERRMIGTLPTAGTTAPAPQLTTGLPPTQAAVLGAAGEVIKEDLPRTLAEAKEAPTRIGIFENIKKLAPDAFTGPTAERRQMVASLAQTLGIPAFTLETASTDELMKNTKLLQMAGGNTDAARALAEFANPNNKMTKEGIARVANQLVSIEKMKLARSQYLTPAQNDAEQYLRRKQDFDSISDPRLFQEMTKEDVAKLKASMSQAEQAELTAKIRKARELGIIK